MHLGDGSRSRRDDVSEPGDDSRERSLADENQWPIDEGDALSWSLKRLTLLCEQLDVGHDLGGG